jgi:hypothetical protein
MQEILGAVAAKYVRTKRHNKAWPRIEFKTIPVKHLAGYVSAGMFTYS